MSMRRNESEIVLRKDSEWSQIDGEICRAADFGTLGSFVDVNGKVHAGTRSMPYASLTLECERLGKNVIGYICHRMDFQYLWAAFKERTTSKDEEVIIVWTREHYKRKLTRLLSFSMPKLQVMICRKGAYELMINPKCNPELSGTAWFAATRPLIWWKPEVME